MKFCRDGSAGLPESALRCAELAWHAHWVETMRKIAVRKRAVPDPHENRSLCVRERDYFQSRTQAAAAVAPIVIRLSTRRTPGADHAARSASSRSNHERTEPRRVTLSPSVSTVMRLASTSALRLSAASIALFTTILLTCGLTSIRLLTPLTPVRYRTAFSAADFWNCHSTLPSRVIQPLDTLTLIRSAGTEMDQSRAFTAARAISSSERSLEVGNRISSSFATTLTPETPVATRDVRRKRISFCRV